MTQLTLVGVEKADTRMATVTVAAPNMDMLTDADAINFATSASGLGSPGFDSMLTGGAFPVNEHGQEVDGLTLNAPITAWHRQFVIRGGM